MNLIESYLTIDQSWLYLYTICAQQKMRYELAQNEYRKSQFQIFLGYDTRCT